MKFILLFLSLVLSVYCNRPIDSIKHIIVIIQENWSFDGLFGLLDGVDGVKPENYVKQVTKDDVPYETLMRPTLDDGKTIDERFPATLPNEWINLTQYVPNTNKTRDLVHRFYTHQRQLNGGKLNKFYAYTDAALLTTSYVGSYSDLPFQKLASQYTICNRYFQGHFGGSFLSHYWIVANAAPQWPSPEVKPYPPGFLSKISESGELISDAQLTVDGKYAVNTIFSENTPYPPYSKPEQRLPPQTMTNIGDLLTEKEVDWRYYSGGWDKVMANPNVTDPLFQYHHQPFAYFAKYGDKTEARKKHLVDEKDFYSDLENHRVPPVSWIKFYGLENEHPGYSDLVTGNTHLANVVKKIQESDIWKDTVIIVTHDEFGGRFDHVPPPVVDEFGPGTRVATIIISPFAKKEYIDNTSFYTHDSLNKFISVRFGITPHNKRVENASFFDNAFDWNLTGQCCSEGFTLKANATCNYQGACQDCCEKIPEGYGLGILIGAILFIIGGAVVFFLFVTFVIGCKSDKSKDLNYMQVDNPLHQSVQF